MKTDEEVALFLLDRYEKETSSPTSYKDRMSTQCQMLTPSPCRKDFPMEAVEESEKITMSAVEEVEVSVDWEDKTSSADEETDLSSSEEGATEELDSEDPDYTPHSCVWIRKVNKKMSQKSHLQTRKETSGCVGDLQTPLLESDERMNSSNEQLQGKFPEESKQHEWPHRTKKIFECPTCGRVFPHNSALKRHLVIHSGKKPFKCFICGRGFTQGGNLKTHMKVHKGESSNWTLVQEKSPPKESPVTVHVCGECGMDFPQKQQLEEHRESHKKPYACPECGKTFKNKDYFKIHTDSHLGDSPFLCSVCGRNCVTADLLKKHELTHTGERNFHCGQCGRTFSQTSHLNVHLKTHSGERPHLCAICGKSYSRAGHLRIHLRVHTGERPYTCEKCGKSFYYSQNYKLHMKRHNKKPKPPTKPLGRPKQPSDGKSLITQQ